jgi:hypothetical protein
VLQEDKGEMIEIEFIFEAGHIIGGRGMLRDSQLKCIGTVTRGNWQNTKAPSGACEHFINFKKPMLGYFPPPYHFLHGSTKPREEGKKRFTGASPSRFHPFRDIVPMRPDKVAVQFHSCQRFSS